MIIFQDERSKGKSKSVKIASRKKRVGKLKYLILLRRKLEVTVLFASTALDLVCNGLLALEKWHTGVQ